MKKIILVDDEFDLIETYGSFLKEKLSELEVVLAKSGNEALKKIQQDSSFSLIVSDIQMEDGDGLALLKELTKISKDFTSKFAFLTGLEDVNDDDLFQIGAADVWYKPLSKEEFLEKVLKALEPSS